jgi:DNA-binding response OmpR family regulator
MIFITALDDPQVKMQAIGAGAIEVLSKPFDHEVLLEKVRAALKD